MYTSFGQTMKNGFFVNRKMYHLVTPSKRMHNVGKYQLQLHVDQHSKYQLQLQLHNLSGPKCFQLLVYVPPGLVLGPSKSNLKKIKNTMNSSLIYKRS